MGRPLRCGGSTSEESTWPERPTALLLRGQGRVSYRISQLGEGSPRQRQQHMKGPGLRECVKFVPPV